MNKPIKDLKPHPLNVEIYQDRADAELIESVRANGILQPVLIDLSNLVISGHRRVDAARKAGLDKIPVVLFPSEDEIEVMTALVEANRQRTKTNEQSAREAACLFRLESEKAQSRRAQARAKDKDPAKSPEESGDARDRGRWFGQKGLGFGLPPIRTQWSLAATTRTALLFSPVQPAAVILRQTDGARRSPKGKKRQPIC